LGVAPIATISGWGRPPKDRRALEVNPEWDPRKAASIIDQNRSFRRYTVQEPEVLPGPGPLNPLETLQRVRGSVAISNKRLNDRATSVSRHGTEDRDTPERLKTKLEERPQTGSRDLAHRVGDERTFKIKSNYFHPIREAFRSMDPLAA
jgi:hypothetical protein